MDTHHFPGFAEPVSAWLHLGGVLAFAVWTVFLLRRGRGNTLRLVFLGVFAFSSLLLLSVSGVYHMLREGGTGRAVLFRLDKAAIFVLIAGTFTPVQGICFRGIARWGVLGVMWALVATGITLFTVYFEQLPRGLGTSMYLALGWIAGASAVVLWRRHGFALIRPVVAGGVAYSVGAILLGLGWPTIIPSVIGPHELWHVAVLTGIALHWSFVYRIAAAPVSGAPPARY